MGLHSEEVFQVVELLPAGGRGVSRVSNDKWSGTRPGPGLFTLTGVAPHHPIPAWCSAPGLAPGLSIHA